MGKVLITVNNVADYIENKKFTVDKNMILSAGAKDYLTENNIELNYEECLESENKKSGTECLEERIKRVLKNEYNISDKKVIELVLKRINRG